MLTKIDQRIAHNCRRRLHHRIVVAERLRAPGAATNASTTTRATATTATATVGAANIGGGNGSRATRASRRRRTLFLQSAAVRLCEASSLVRQRLRGTKN
jgi:hypothetical protein